MAVADQDWSQGRRHPDDLDQMAVDGCSVMKVWNVWSWSDRDRILDATFATKEAADAYATTDEREVEECEVLGAPPEPWHWWIRAAEVYPDKIVKKWAKREVSDSPQKWLAPVDDDLNRDRVWDGHSQGHCGEHIYISGTDRKAVNDAFSLRLEEALARQDGTCKSKRSHDGDIDGRTVYQTGFWGEVRRAGSRKVEKMECLNRFEHSWPQIEGSCRNGCGSFRVSLSASFTIPVSSPDKTTDTQVSEQP